MTPSELALAALVVFSGALVQGSVGFGYALFSAPLLLLIEPRLVPGPLLASALGLTVLMAIRDRKAMDLRGIGWALLGRIPGALAGGLALAVVTERTLGTLVGALVLVAVAMIASGWHPHPRRPTLLAAGFFSGFMGTTASIGGPPIAMLYARSMSSEMRGTLAGYFTAGLAMSLFVVALAGHLSVEQLMWAAILSPGVFAGFVGSRCVADRLSPGAARYAVLLVSTGGGVAAILRNW